MYYILGCAILFAGFFLAHAVLALLAVGSRSYFEPILNSQRPAVRARIWFAANLAPVTLALVFASLLLASFLRYEPVETDEGIGWVLGAFALLGLAGILRAGWRLFSTRRATRTLLANWQTNATPASIAGWTRSAYKLEHAFPLIAVVGVWRPRLFVAAKVVDQLDRDELNAAVAHEIGHILARDNFKRCLVELAGGLAWWVPGSAKLRVGWADAAEHAADEFAASGDQRQPLNLASALVKLARMTPAGTRPAMPAGAFLVEAPGDILTRRVNWLVNISPDLPAYTARNLNFSMAMSVLLLGLLAVVSTRFDLLERIHQLIESVVQ